MTLVVAINNKNSVIVASDKRASKWGEIQTSYDQAIKTFPVNQFAGLSLAGSAGVGLYVIDRYLEHFKSIAQKDVMDVIEVLDDFRKFCLRQFRDLLPHVGIDNKSYPHVAFLVFGFIRGTGAAKKEPRLFVLNSWQDFAPNQAPANFATLGITKLADYLLNRFCSGDIPTRSAEKIAYFCLKETASQEGGVGQEIDVGILYNDRDAFIKRTPSEIADLEQEYTASRESIARVFLPYEDIEQIDTGPNTEQPPGQ